MARPLSSLAVTCLLLTVLAAPQALADHRPPCEEVTPQPMDAPVYVHQPRMDVEAWQESNEVPGLQRVSCTQEDGTHAQADTLLAKAGKTTVDETAEFVFEVEALACQVVDNLTPFKFICLSEFVGL